MARVEVEFWSVLETKIIYMREKAQYFLHSFSIVSNKVGKEQRLALSDLDKQYLHLGRSLTWNLKMMIRKTGIIPSLPLIWPRCLMSGISDFLKFNPVSLLLHIKMSLLLCMIFLVKWLQTTINPNLPRLLWRSRRRNRVRVPTLP